MNKIDLSIIIISYNTVTLLDKCLNSIYKSLSHTEIEYEIIVVDNGSEDKSCDLIGKKYPDVILVRNKINLGFGKANNQAAEISKGKFLLFLNSDIEVTGNAIYELYKFSVLQSDKTITGGKLFNADGKPQPSCGPQYSLLNIFIALFLKGDYLNLTRYSPDKIRNVDWVMGACMSMNKDFFEKLGGFDSKIFMYMEEIDLEYRAKKMGGEILFYPDARFIHLGAGSSNGRETPILNVFKGLRIFYKKNKPEWQNILLRVILVLKSILAIILFQVLNKKNDRNLYIKALNLAIYKI